jgi:hypothetical protein
VALINGVWFRIFQGFFVGKSIRKVNTPYGSTLFFLRPIQGNKAKVYDWAKADQ